MAAGNGGQKMSQYPWFTVYAALRTSWFYYKTEQVFDSRRKKKSRARC